MEMGMELTRNISGMGRGEPPCAAPGEPLAPPIWLAVQFAIAGLVDGAGENILVDGNRSVHNEERGYSIP